MALSASLTHRRADVVFATVLILAAGTLYREAGHFSNTGAAFPRVLTVLLALCALVVIVREIKFPAGAERPLFAQPVRVVMGFLLMFAYITAMDAIGYVLASVIFGLGIPWLFGYRHWRLSLPVVLGTLCFILVVFRLLLERPLPSGAIAALLEPLL